MISGSLAERLRVLRAQRGMTLVEAAEQAGVGRDTLSDLERGRRHPAMLTLARIAQGYGVPVEDLLEDWRQAYDNSRRFRADAKERLRERLELWEVAKEEGDSDERRRELLDEVGQILDEAKNEVLGKLLENVNDGLDHMAKPSPEGTPNAYWEEVRKIDTLYHELRAMVEGAGLSVRAKTPSDTVQGRRYELEAVAR